MTCRLYGYAVLFLLAAGGLAQAQVSPSGLLSEEGARRAGLERMWFTQLELDSARGRVAGLIQHVSATHAHTVFEVAYQGRSYRFSDRELDAFGKPVGIEGARKLADEKVAEIKDKMTELNGGMPPPDDQLPTVQTHVIPQITMYATSQGGVIHAIDGETGKTLWTTGIGNHVLITSVAGASDDYVAALNGSTMYCLHARDGAMAWQRMVSGAPLTGPAVSDDLVFVVVANGNMESFRADDPRIPSPVFRSFGRPSCQPVIFKRSVAWTTDRGHVYVGQSHDAKMLFRLEAKDRIDSAPAFLPPDKIVATSLDGYVYCFDEVRGGILWRFSTGEPIVHQPVCLNDTVYAITQAGGLYAIDSGGLERWVTGGIRGFISGNTDRLYCTDVAGNIVVLDAVSGSRVGSILAPSLDLRPINQETDRLIVGTSRGMIQCFREIDKQWPEVRILRQPPLPRAKKDDKKGKQKEGETAPMPIDPFSAPPATTPPAGATDPFGGAAPPAGGAGGAAPPAGADPFGRKP
ncbi:MAG TPA: PQQ-binding-like beta-propeller repeat protein [Pirellulaceae bacterium]|nr:PQQ-binding-like beta-propeller repeat protein [Pirellulaceae bacterium]